MNISHIDQKSWKRQVALAQLVTDNLSKYIKIFGKIPLRILGVRA